VYISSGTTSVSSGDGVITAGSTFPHDGWGITSVGSTNTILPKLEFCEVESKSMKYLYKAYVIVGGNVEPELPPFVAKDEVSAKVKAIIAAKVDPDEAYVILQELGEIPDNGNIRNIVDRVVNIIADELEQ